MAKANKIPVTKRALIQRLQRALHHDDLILKTARSERVRLDLGDYYTVSVQHAGLMDRDVDLEELGREYGVLKDYEKLESE